MKPEAGRVNHRDDGLPGDNGVSRLGLTGDHKTVHGGGQAQVVTLFYQAGPFCLDSGQVLPRGIKIGAGGGKCGLSRLGFLMFPIG